MMDVITLKGIYQIDPEVETEYVFINSAKHTCGPHRHDFFELFLLVEGEVYHCINHKRQKLFEGDLVFIRPDDVHYYEMMDGKDCKFINLSFLDKTVRELFDFLGEGFPKSKLCAPAMPPTISLSSSEKEYVRGRLDRINMIPQSHKKMIKAELRVVLTDLFSRYFLDPLFGVPQGLAHWFEYVCAEMKRTENFTVGLKAMMHLSGKSHSHLCHCFKKYLGVTPADYINGLRLNYAENLLLNTDLDILSVCYESGFDNVAYFYKLFKNQFGLPPSKYRARHQRKFTIW